MSIKIFRRGSGYTPITIPVLSRLVIIKLGIDNFLDVEKIIYQFSHELCHFIYYCLYGLNKQFADEKEEAICTAMSLCCLKQFGINIDKWNNHVKSLKREGYRNGFLEAQAVDFEIKKLSQKIKDMSKHKGDYKMDRVTFLQNYWNYYLVLEKKFINSTNYVAVNESNYNTYSFEFVNLILLIGSELDVTMKLLSNIPQTQNSNIQAYADYIFSCPCCGFQRKARMLKKISSRKLPKIKDFIFMFLINFVVLFFCNAVSFKWEIITSDLIQSWELE